MDSFAQDRLPPEEEWPVLTPLPYARKDAKALGALDPKIVGGPEDVTAGGGA